MMISIKVHESYRRVVAVCDQELLGKRFEEGKLQLDLRENFYKGNVFDEHEAVKQLQRHMIEDATFNIVGEKSIRAAIDAQIIDEESVARIKSVPFALKLI